MEENTKYGVIYRDQDYAGFFRRALIVFIDLLIVLPLVALGSWIDDSLYENTATYAESYGFYASLFVAYIYLTYIKASKIGTLGQALTKTRIETIFGKRAGQARMTLRLLYWVLGPINVIADLVFIGAIKERRSIRDCLCNTIVVDKNAVPIERRAPVHVARIYAMGLNLMYESCNSECSS